MFWLFMGMVVLKVSSMLVVLSISFLSRWLRVCSRWFMVMEVRWMVFLSLFIGRVTEGSLGLGFGSLGKFLLGCRLCLEFMFLVCS